MHQLQATQSSGNVKELTDRNGSQNGFMADSQSTEESSVKLSAREGPIEVDIEARRKGLLEENLSDKSTEEHSSTEVISKHNFSDEHKEGRPIAQKIPRNDYLSESQDEMMSLDCLSIIPSEENNIESNPSEDQSDVETVVKVSSNAGMQLTEHSSCLEASISSENEAMQNQNDYKISRRYIHPNCVTVSEHGILKR